MEKKTKEQGKNIREPRNIKGENEIKRVSTRELEWTTLWWDWRLFQVAPEPAKVVSESAAAAAAGETAGNLQDTAAAAEWEYRGWWE